MGEILTIPARNLAATLNDEALFRDIERGDLHPNMRRVYDAAHGGPLTFSPGGSGSENQRQGDEAAALFSARVAFDRDEVPLPNFMAMTRAVYEHLQAERELGQCRKEVLSPNYWHLSAMFRALALREVVGLLAHFGNGGGSYRLPQIAAELIVWFRVHRHLVRRFQARDGLVWHPGLRRKSDSDANELPNVFADCYERPVTHTRVRSMLRELREGKPSRVANRGHATMAMRIYESPFGRWLESVTQPAVPGRLSVDVGWTGDGLGNFQAIMPAVRAIHTSPIRGGRGNQPTRIVFEVDATGTGRPKLVDFSEHVPVGEVVRHPNGREIPKGWDVFGPDTPPPEVPEVLVDGAVHRRPGGEEPKPARPPMIPRWLARKWLSGDAPAWAVKHLPEILWQAQRMELGEVEAEGMLVKAVERMNEGRGDDEQPREG